METDANRVIAVTSGEPAGIGPDICLDLAAGVGGVRVVAVGNLDLLRQRAALLGKRVLLQPYVRAQSAVAGTLEVLDLPLKVACKPGRLDPRNSGYVLEMIDRAYDGCVAGEFAAMVTAPISKAAINDAGIPFTGHTEYLAERAGGVHVVMMLVGGGLRVALATTHLPLQEVPGAITQTSLEQTLRVLVAGLREDFGMNSPRVLVAGLNPHSGEGGHLGCEEINVIRPVLERLRAQGMDLSEPLPADTLFNPERLRGADCVLAMYHDQGLPVLKFASFGSGVNVTLGPPLIRTSVDHGTALDIAGSGTAASGSLMEAVQLAATMVKARARNARR